MNKKGWYQGVVNSGNRIGKTNGFPTINLNPVLLPAELPKGVYATKVRYKQRIFKGALYFGPRLVLGETRTVLEIHIINFAQNIYGKSVEFIILDFIRPPRNFSSLAELKKQLQKDTSRVNEVLTA